jgi:hypothetical protein
MDTSEEDVRRPVALMIFAVLAVLGLVVTFVLGRDGDEEPSQAQQQVATSVAVVQDELSNLPGVRAVEVTSTTGCLDDCTEAGSSYLATVQLRLDVTAQQISAVVSAHDESALQNVGLAAVPTTLMLTPTTTLRVSSVHYGFGVTQAEAFLSAATGPANVQVEYGPPTAGESPLLTVAAILPGMVCDNADTAMAQVVPSVGAAAYDGGIPFGAVRFDCGSVALEAGIASGAVYQTGWTQAATSVDRVCRENGCGQSFGVLQDVSVVFEGGSTQVVVELNDGQQLPPDDLAAMQAAVDALVAAGAVNPQLVLENY